MSCLSGIIKNAYKVLDGADINKGEALSLLQLNRVDAMDLYSLANKVRFKFCKDEFNTCEITNAKSGACSENCSFCAQSSHNATDIKVYPFKSIDEILQDAGAAKGNGADAFCIVVSGCGHEKVSEEFNKIVEAAKAIIRETGLEVHASPGMLSDETASILKNAGVRMINHNLETAPSFYDKVCSTHSIQKRIDTVKAVKKAGMKACSGGIIGLGESLEDRIELAFTLKELNVDVIPINVLRKITGTRVAETEFNIREIINTVAVFRLINKDKIIKIAAGRETALADYQGLVFHAGANAMIIGGYLTLRGRPVSDDRKLIESINSLPA